MEILVGKNAGFCYGVKRAVDGANEELKKEKEPIYCLGEIVHNKNVVENLQKQGMNFIDQISESKGTTLIRAHGVEKNIYQKAKELNIQLKDYTCPKVIKIHEIAEKYAKQGYYIFLTGSKTHPENIGTISFCGNNIFVIEDENMIDEAVCEFNKTSIKKLLIISQTTFSLEKFEYITNKIKQNLPNNIELVIKNTICAATKIRQQEVEELAKQVDMMIIVGGKNSSNTKKLYDIAKKYCKKSICIENENEIDTHKIYPNDSIGIMAGASTPQESINKVIEMLKKI